MEDIPQRQEIARALCKYGLRVNPTDLSKTEKQEIAKSVNILLWKCDNDHRLLLDVIQYGMKEIWPFSTGAPYDGFDISKHLTKAKGAANKMHRSGRIPVTPEQLDAIHRRRVDEQPSV